MIQAGFFALALVVSGASYADFPVKSKRTPSTAYLAFVVCGLIVSAGWQQGANTITGLLMFSLLTIDLGLWRFRARDDGPAVGVWAGAGCFVITGKAGRQFFPL